jgi:hypothetical protein
MRWLTAFALLIAFVTLVGSATAEANIDLVDPDVRVADNFYPCPLNTDGDQPLVSECFDGSDQPLAFPATGLGPVSCDEDGASTIAINRTTGSAFVPVGTPWLNGTVHWDLTATIDAQTGPAAPEFPPLQNDGIQTGSVGFSTGALSLTGTVRIDTNGDSNADIVADVTSVDNVGNWGVCRTFIEEVTNNPMFGPAPITGSFYILNAGVLQYDVTTGPTELDGDSGIAEAYFSNSLAWCCQAASPSGVNSATGHFRLQFGTNHPGEGTGGIAATPPGTNVEVSDFDLDNEDVAGVSLTFDNVEDTGTVAETSVVLLTSMPAQPSGFQVGDPPAVYQIETTATGWDEILVCLPYGSLPAGVTPQIKHYDIGLGQWVDVPTFSDSGLPDRIICGFVDSLSPFAVGYTHIYNVSGPFQPVDSHPTPNTMKAGRTVPVKFSLGGDYGFDVFADDYPTSVGDAACGGPADVVETTTTNASGLTYDAVSGIYQYNWKTSSGWKGQCRTLILKFGDGQELKAEFKFN